MKIKFVAVTLICIASLRGLSQPVTKQYWFEPVEPGQILGWKNPCYDYSDLFAPNAPWAQAANHINVFFIANPEYISDTLLGQMITFLKQHNIKLGISFGPLFPEGNCGWDVEGFSGGVGQWSDWADKIAQLGGTLDIINFDEPYMGAHYNNGPHACHWPLEKIALKLDEFIQGMRAKLPNVEFWDNELLNPSDTLIDFNAYKTWLDTFKLVNGYPMPGLNVEFWSSQPNAYDQLKSLETYTKQQGIPFGVMYNSSNPNKPNTNAGWLNDWHSDWSDQWCFCWRA